MTHKEALNLMLANSCPKETYQLETGDDVTVFELELHCATARVEAVLVSTVNTIQYDILKVEFVDE